MTSVVLLIGILVFALGVRRIVATLTDLQTSITNLTAATNALTAAAGTIQPPHDFQPEVDAINANTAAVNTVTTQLGGTPPGP